MQGQQHWSNYLLPAQRETRVTLPVPIQELVTVLLGTLHTAASASAGNNSDAVSAAVESLVASYREAAVDQAFALAIEFEYVNAEGALQPAGVEHLKAANTVSARLKKARASRESQRSLQVGTIFTSDYVRQDLHKTIAAIKAEAASRKIIGVDMEVDAFYKNLADSRVFYLAVKGVCDFGDQWKDDAYHDIAAEHAAAVLFDFVIQYVESNEDDAEEGGDRTAEQRADLDEVVRVDLSLDPTLRAYVAKVEQLRQKQAEAEKGWSEFEKKLHDDALYQTAMKQMQKRRDELRAEAKLPECPASKQIAEAVNSVGQHLRQQNPTSLHFRLSSGEAVICVDGKRPNGQITKTFLRSSLGRKLADSYIEDCNNQKKITWSVDGIAAAAGREETEDDVEAGDGADVGAKNSGIDDESSIEAASDWEQGTGSMIERLRYTSPQELLEVKIKGGAVFSHPGVPGDVYQRFRSAESMGKFYHAHIKSKYQTL